jgi:hypothetical protein
MTWHGTSVYHRPPGGVETRSGDQDTRDGHAIRPFCPCPSGERGSEYDGTTAGSGYVAVLSASSPSTERSATANSAGPARACARPAARPARSQLVGCLAVSSAASYHSAPPSPAATLPAAPPGTAGRPRPHGATPTPSAARSPVRTSDSGPPLRSVPAPAMPRAVPTAGRHPPRPEPRSSTRSTASSLDRIRWRTVRTRPADVCASADASTPTSPDPRTPMAAPRAGHASRTASRHRDASANVSPGVRRGNLP